jgi:membrane protein
VGVGLDLALTRLVRPKLCEDPFENFIINSPVRLTNSECGFVDVAPARQAIAAAKLAVAGSHQNGLGFAALLGLLIAFYSASTGMASLMQGLNIAYDEKETRGFIERMLVTSSLTLLLIAGLVCGLCTTLAMPVIPSIVDMGRVVAMPVNAALWVGLIALTIVGLSVLYRFAPSRDTPVWKWTSVGAILGCLVWIAASASFAFYVSNFSYYNLSFGALAGVEVLLMWFRISAYIILQGRN